MGKLMRVTYGEAFLVAVDIRKNSPTLGQWYGEIVSAENQKMVWAQSPLVPMAQRVLYANLGYIFDQLEFDNPNFYKIPYDDQKELVDKKVIEITAMLAGAAAPTIQA